MTAARYIAAFAAGAATAFAVSVALIPDQPDRVYVPVEAPPARFTVDPGVTT